MRALVVVVVLGVLVVCGGLWMEYQNFVSEPMALEREAQLLEVEPGDSLRRVTEKLTAQGMLEHPYLFVAMAYFRDEEKRIKAGEYEIKKGTTPSQLLKLLTSGTVIQHAFTLIEGWNYEQFIKSLVENERLENRLGDDPSAKLVMKRLGYPDQDPEGRFLPETYYFAKGTSDLDILRRAYESMTKALSEEWDERKEGLPFKDPYEALTLASIVEKETGLASERPVIAGVFVRRLHLGMKLQTDPTVIYGLSDRFDGNITRSHLVEDTPYNTYVHAGLPPTPIAMPGRDAIHAVLHPAQDDSLFFVAKGDGSHHFSATLAEHNKAVRRYQLGKR